MSFSKKTSRACSSAYCPTPWRIFLLKLRHFLNLQDQLSDDQQKFLPNFCVISSLFFFAIWPLRVGFFPGPSQSIALGHSPPAHLFQICGPDLWSFSHCPCSHPILLSHLENLVQCCPLHLYCLGNLYLCYLKGGNHFVPSTGVPWRDKGQSGKTFHQDLEV